MELRHLRYFVAVAETGHVGRAAERLHIAQPPLSRQLQDLERELGVPLFTRHARGMALTPAGAEFLGHARRILAESALAVEHIRRVSSSERPLRVGIFDFGGGERILARALAAFRAMHPHAAVRIDPTPVLEQAALVRDERLDIGFHVGLPIDEATVVSECLLEDPVAGALLPAWHRLAICETLEPSDLSRVPFVALPRALQPREKDDEFTRLRAAGWRGQLDIEEGRGAVVVSMVRHGVGWAHAPRSFIGGAPDGTVYRPMEAGSGTPFDVLALTRRGDNDPLVTAFLEYLRGAAHEEPTTLVK